MDEIHATFDLRAWTVALDRFGEVAHLSVALYDADGRIIEGPAPVTALHAIFQEHDHDPGLLAECVRQCLAQPIAHRPVVIVRSASGIAVIGASLLLDGAIVGAVVAAYAVLDFSEPVGVARVARESGITFARLWDIVRQQQPIPTRRLVLHGELLQLLGDTLLRETHRTRQYEEAAAELTKALAAKDEFLAVLSHELRSPLTPILGWADILKAPDNTVEVRKAGGVIERNARLQLRLVDDLLELNRTAGAAAVLDLKVIGLDDALSGALEAIADAARAKGVAIHARNDGGSPCIEADNDRLQQILRNVLSNALKFTPKGARVDVTLETSGDRAVVRVQDTGSGIAPRFLPFVFDMFRQEEQGERRAHGGLGIGLALVKRLMTAHGGSVTIESEGAGRGTVATLSFPVVADSRPAVDPVVLDRRDGADLHGVRVLVVDDMADMRDFMRATLERFGAEVYSAGDGFAALTGLAREPVDLVLCDLRMPRMDGFEFLSELKRRDGTGHVPVIAVSALASSGDHLRTVAAGFGGHLDKPFADADLLAQVGAVMERRVKESP